MKWSFKRELFPIIFFLIIASLALYYYPQLPDPMPSHFDAQGHINGWMAKTSFCLLMFGLMIAVYVCFTFVPFIDPLWKKIEGKYDLFLLIRDICVAFIGFILILNGIAGFEGALRSNVMGIGLGLFFIVMGNYMPKLPRNWFIGIRTPWTISSDKIWKKTHILGGWLSLCSGMILVVLSLLKIDFVIGLIGCLLPTVIISGIIYPFYLFKKYQKTGEL